MIDKCIDPGEFTFNDAVFSIMKVHRRGVDKDWAEKKAAVLTREIMDLRPEPGVTFVHMNAVGDMEWTGFNRNGDGFPARENIAQHPTFVKHAQFYHNHKNKPHLGDPNFGFVKHSAYNPEMHRIELVVGIRDADDPDTIQKIASDEGIEVSMACHIHHDECSNCGNKATKAAEYCDCIRNHCGEMMKSGGVIGMINIAPDFFDISKVGRGAERTARSFRKVAGCKDGLPISVAAAIEYGVTDPNSPEFLEKIGTWLKMSKAASEAVASPLVTSMLNEPVPYDVCHSERAAAETLGALEKVGVVLGIDDFFRVVLGQRYPAMQTKVAEAQRYMPYVWRGRGNAEAVIAESLAFDALPTGTVKTAALSYAMREAAILQRLSHGTIKAAAAVEYTDQVSTLAKNCAVAYAGYKLACAHRADDAFSMRMMVLQDGIV